MSELVTVTFWSDLRKWIKLGALLRTYFLPFSLPYLVISVNPSSITASSSQSFQLGKALEDVRPTVSGSSDGKTATSASSTGGEQNGTPGGPADIFTATESKDQATFYQPGMELTELWCDFERALKWGNQYRVFETFCVLTFWAKLTCYIH